MTRSHSLILTLAALALMTACNGGSRPVRIGSQAPDFTVKDSDRAVTLSQFRGKPVILNFWATWCPPCIEETPSLVDLQRKFQDSVVVLAVSVDVDEAAYRRFLKDHKVDLLTVRDGDQRSNSLYGTYKFPETYIIDKDGVIRRKFIGAVDWNTPEIAEYLQKLM